MTAHGKLLSMDSTILTHVSPQAVVAPEWVVYRLFDVSDRLLYVGMTSDVKARLKTHQRDQPWWGEVKSVRLEECRDGVEAAQREMEVIELEGPIHNIVGQRTFRQMELNRRDELQLKEIGRRARDQEVRGFRAGLTVGPALDSVRSRVTTCRFCGAMGLVFARSNNRMKRHKAYLVEAYRVEPNGMAEGNRYHFHKCPAYKSGS